VPNLWTKGEWKKIVRELRVNQLIRAREVRVIGEDGSQLGIMPTTQALEQARSQGFDLVEVSSTSAPPVCRILDYGKYRYNLDKKERKARKGQKSNVVKEIRIRPKINEHDLMAKVSSIIKMLEEGNKVKVSVVLRGRENSHPELGWKAMRKVAESLKEKAVADAAPAMEGSSINLTFSPPKTASKPTVKPETAKAPAAGKPEAKPVKDKETNNA
jgi:translation initiation factor IF-3